MLISSALAMLTYCTPVAGNSASSVLRHPAPRQQSAPVLRRVTAASLKVDDVPSRYARDDVNRVLGIDPEREQEKAKSFVAFVILPVTLTLLLAALMRRAQF